MISPWFRACCVVLAWGAWSGCSLLIDVEGDQCVRDQDCAAVGVAGTCQQGVCVRVEDSIMTDDGGSGDAAPADIPLGGSCLGSLRCEDEDAVCFKDECVLERTVERFLCQEGEPPAMTETVRFTMPVRDFVTEEPVSDLVVLACQENDASCDNPVARFEDEAGTGDVELELPYGFAGYLEVRSPDVLTSLWYFTEPLLEPTEAKVLKVVAPSTAQLLAGITSLTIDASKGLVILEPFDCQKTAVGGIHFEESKQEAIPFFIIDGLPNTESTVTVRNELDNQAAGGFLNATPGFTLFSARIGVGGPLLGRFNANVRANTVTYLDFHP